MSRREDYKRFIVFCLASLVIIAQAAAFAYVWYDYYRETDGRTILEKEVTGR